MPCAGATDWPNPMTASGEEQFIAEHLAPLTRGIPSAFDLRDDCAEWTLLPGHSLVVKTDPIVEGVHFFSEDTPEDLAWKALAVNVSDLVAKAARPVAYLMALTLPARPQDNWMRRFASGLSDAQQAFGCVLVGGDTDQRDGPLSIAITMLGETPSDGMIRRQGARVGDLVYVSGELGGAALGLNLRRDADFHGGVVSERDRAAALARYLRPAPKLGIRAALRAAARSAMDISDGLVKDLDRMCRLTGVGAELELASLPLAAGVRSIFTSNVDEGLRLASAGDDYEVLATVPESEGRRFERLAGKGGVRVTCIGRIVSSPGVRMAGLSADNVAKMTGYDHFDKNTGG